MSTAPSATATALAERPGTALDLSPALVGEAADRALQRWAVCGLGFVILLLWAQLYPYSGDGDSALHFLNARDAAATPVSALHAWARPVCKLIMAPFALYGILPTRAAMALVSALVCWQTIRLAEELSLPNALLAGPMVFWQGMAFALGSDTMTEMPMALGAVTAIRLWRNGWWRTSALLVGFLPAVRPEGFFLGVLWGLLALFSRRDEGKAILLRLTTLAAMTVGLITWVLACWALTWNHDALYVLTIWNWPPGSYAAYGRGSLLHHVIYWPQYCGVPMTALFLIGLPAAFRRMRGDMFLPWAVWLTVFVVHSILYWGGWFASCGLMRIMASTSPVTALICLHGWNRVIDLLRERGSWRRWLAPRTAGWAMAILCTAWAFAQYALNPSHYECFPIARCAQYIRDNHLLAADTAFFAGNAMDTAALDFPPHCSRVMETPCDPEQIRQNLAALPIGAVGIWDNRQAPVWHGHEIADLVGHGFTLLYDTTTAAPDLGRTIPLRYVVLRKDAPFTEAHAPRQ
jgi:hypothetical protein